jgi:hypothetical protein
VLDQFDDAQAYDGWIEFNDDFNIQNNTYTAQNGSPTEGEIQIALDSGNFRLRLSDDDDEIGVADLVQRTFDLSGSSSATLTFDYRRQSVNDDFFVEVWDAQQQEWDEIGQIGATASGTFTDTSYQTFTFNLTDYISAQGTTIRFSVGDDVDGNDIVYVDNFQIVPYLVA